MFLAKRHRLCIPNNRSYGGAKVLATIFTVLMSGMMLAVITVLSTGVLIHAQRKLEREQMTANTADSRRGRSH